MPRDQGFKAIARDPGIWMRQVDVKLCIGDTGISDHLTESPALRIHRCRWAGWSYVDSIGSRPEREERSQRRHPSASNGYRVDKSQRTSPKESGYCHTLAKFANRRVLTTTMREACHATSCNSPHGKPSEIVKCAEFEPCRAHHPPRENFRQTWPI